MHVCARAVSAIKSPLLRVALGEPLVGEKTPLSSRASRIEAR